jgi:zinc transport system substrate-binding protein
MILPVKPMIDKSTSLMIRNIKYAKHSLAISLLMASIVIISVACNTESSDNTGTLVVTTIYPLEYFAQRIGGDKVSVTNLLKPGVEAHSFEPTPDDIRKLDAADVIIYNGSGLEPWVGRALSAMGNDSNQRLIIETSSELTNENDYTEIDPHIWLDPLKAIEQVKLIRDSLISANLEGEDTYTANAENLLTEILSLHQAYSNGLVKCATTQFVTSHAAFGHLAKRYGLEQIPISGLSQEVEPGPADLARIIDTALKIGVHYVMVEPIISTSYAETMAWEINAKLLPLHPLESLTSEESDRGEDYFSIMETNMENLKLALECTA